MTVPTQAVPGSCGQGTVTKDWGDVFTAMKAGSFCATTGTQINDVGRNDNELFLQFEEETRIRLIGNSNRILAEVVNDNLRWNWTAAPEDVTYGRFEVVDRNLNVAWSQPFFKI